MADRISSLDSGYVIGDLSVYPEAIDDKEILYEARNNAITTLKQILPFNGRKIISYDASKFPPQGLLRIGPPPGTFGLAELIYYGKRTDSVFSDLKRGFAGSRQNQWEMGAYITNAVMAEHHNALLDSIINIENNLGLKTNPNPVSLNGILVGLESRFLAPKPIFRAFPLKGPPPLQVRFQNFSGGEAIRFLWDFGDGSSSIEESPIHTYQTEGEFTVKLNIITSTGGQGIVQKNGYILVSEDEDLAFYYVLPMEGTSVQTATNLTDEGTPTSPTEFEFVDQTDGQIVQRFWIFDDGETKQEDDPDVHTVSHTYNAPGSYQPTLLVIFEDQRFKRVILDEPIVVF